ncbi:FHA domain-containing protein [Tundrisphaera sp. TA3]|uniref:FHA domain-containing protein n=1 Tax=Tundrisphaera sp. TA3 TaxID=3435775 RepID=UPI003EBE322F
MTAPDPITSWSLEVVRGRKPGQVYPLAANEIVLGNAPTPPSVGIDLAGQEAPTSRRMEAQHAALTWPGGEPSIRDLDSSCGTFVNRRRVLPGQVWPLRAGDEIQLGAVVLRISDDAARAAEPDEAGPPDTFFYVLAGGQACRTWDDFLTASAQRWDSLRDELASGRIDAFLLGIGRGDLRPRSALGSGADDRLDAWLASLPTSRPSRPELDVHPRRILVRASPGGGVVRKTIRVANVGYRLLRSSARVDPPDSPWLKLAPEFDDAPFATVEETEIAFDLIIPELLPVPLAGEIVVEGNGGTKRVAITLEPRRDGDAPPEILTNVATPSPLGGWIDRAGPRQLAREMSLGLAGLRLIVAVAGLFGRPAGLPPGSPAFPGVLVAFGAAGSILGLGLAARLGEPREMPFGAFAGGCVGALISAVVLAACRAFDPQVSGGWAIATLVACLIWAAIGAAAAGLAKLSRRWTQ